MSLLDVTHLQTHFMTAEGVVRAVDGVSFSLERGESLGIVGESGCGKSMMALSLLRLIEPPGKIVGGSLLLNGGGTKGATDIMRFSEREMRSVRGKRIAMVFQEPMTSLNPLYTVGNQIGEAILLHEGGDRMTRRKRTLEMLELVGIPAPDKRIDQYPHELSGGMRQRVMIAMALACRPDILIADEPTTALDATIQAQILQLIADIQKKFGMALILITHDLGVVAEMCRRVIVMYAGQFVESGSVDEIFSHAKHPYTQGLLRSLPGRNVPRLGKLATITGTVPRLTDLPHGCRFADRCPKVQDRCRKEMVPDDPCNVGRLVRCFYAGETHG